VLRAMSGSREPHPFRSLGALQPGDDLAIGGCGTIVF
jgi:hypothetical protein